MFLHVHLLKTEKLIQVVSYKQVISLMLCVHRYAIMCGIMAEYDTVQNKIKNGYIFKVSCCIRRRITCCVWGPAHF